jgi:dihydropyrimidinase
MEASRDMTLSTGDEAETLISGGTLVLPGEAEVVGDLLLRNGQIAERLPPGSGRPTDRVIDARGLHVFPGVIDPHLHIGLGAGLADWGTETASAAVGGVTTVLSFLMAGESYLPLIEKTRSVAEREAHVDFGFHLVPCSQTHLDELSQYVDLGITSFKYFTSFRGDEGAYLGISGTDDGFLFRFLEQVAGYDGVIASIHPENIEVVWVLRERLRQAGRDDLAAWDESRPDSVEAEATFRALYYARQVGSPVYLVHISSRAALDEVRSWRRRFDHHVIAETCPHYLTHTSDMPIRSLGKVNPPLRSDDDREAIWQGVLDGTIDTIGSDHVPRRRERKQGSIWTASAGFPGSATILPLMLSEGHHRRGLSLPRVAELCSAGPARAFGLHPRKGSLEPGADADLAIVDLGREQAATADVLQSHADYSLYEDWVLKGWPVMTVVRGEVVMNDGKVVGLPGHGRYLPRQGTRSERAIHA